MSYDLFLKPREPLSIDELKEYFDDLPNFTVSDERAHYANENTDVYFGFDFTSAGEDGETSIAFNLNYFRPHVFGLEAEPVLTAFVEAFDLSIDDPQSDGMGEGPYSAEGFLRGWNTGNRFGYSGILSLEPAPEVVTLPARTIEGVWRWNMAKDETVEHIVDLVGDVPPCFIPTLMLFRRADGEVQTGIVWDGKMAVAIPDVDLILTPTDDGVLAARAKDVLGLLVVHTRWDADYDVGADVTIGLAASLIDEVPPATSARIRASMRPFAPDRIGLDQVLDAELVAEARSAAARNVRNGPGSAG